MATSKMRPETYDSKGGNYCPTNGTAYLMVYNAVRSKDGLIAGRLHDKGESCAIGSFWDVNPKCSLQTAFIDEVAAVNDSFVGVSPANRRKKMLAWLRWKMQQAGFHPFLVE